MHGLDGILSKGCLGFPQGLLTVAHMGLGFAAHVIHLRLGLIKRHRYCRFLFAVLDCNGLSRGL